jgi:DNA adenine methylase
MGGLGMGGPSRPLVRYHGGKWRLAPWIISHFPRHRIYVEPFGGGASVLLRKARSYAEVYNDLDREVAGLFKVVRERGEELVRLLELTPFAREEFDVAWQPTDDEMERARRALVRSCMGFGSAAVTEARENGRVMTGFRANAHRSGTTPAQDWRNFPAVLVQIIERLRGVCIENREAVACMLPHDSPSTLFYVDPPYVPGSRDAGTDYRHEMKDADHVALAEVLHGLKGKVLVSGYPSDLYEELYKGWVRVEKRAMADGARERVEVLWMNFEVEGMLL